jgi:Flp pilus assembly protein TadG
MNRSAPAARRNGDVTAGCGSPARERGGVTVEYAVLFPVLLVLLLSSVQAAMWWHARNIALAAAQAGVNAGRATGAGPTQAVPAARSFAERAGGSLTAVTTAGSTATTIRVQVSLTAPRVLPIPGLALRVTQTALAGRERFTTPQAPP